MEPAVDLSLHPPQPPSQTLLVANKLVCSTAEQLNTFAATCESKLTAMHHKMLRLETGVKLLEAKLASLPGAAFEAPPPAPPAAPAGPAAVPPPPAEQPAAAAAGVPPPPPQPTPAASVEPPPEPEPPAPEEPVMKVKDDPRFAKYFKMEKMGVPRPAVSIKMRQEGIDPSFLDTPDAPAPPGGEPEPESDEDD